MRIIIAIILGSTLLLNAAVPVSRPTKEFTFTEPEGKQILLSNLRGKVVVIQFLLTTCPHCQAFSKLLTQVNEEYHAKGFQALGATIDGDDTQVTAYMKNFAGFPVGRSTVDTVKSYLGISIVERMAVPQIVVINRKGVIVRQTTATGGPEDLELRNPQRLRALIESLL